MTDALDNLADNTNLLQDFNVGIAEFGDCDVNQILNLSLSTDAATFKGSYSTLTAENNTPTGPAINAVLSGNWLEIAGDPNPGREKRIIVITDGAPTATCGESGMNAEDYTEDRAAAAFASDYPTYFVGFDNLDTSAQNNMQDFAVAGGTDNPNSGDNWFEVSSNDTSDLEDAISTIANLTIPCDVTINPQPGDDLDRMRVSIVENMTTTVVTEGMPDGWTYDFSEGEPI